MGRVTSDTQPTKVVSEVQQTTVGNETLVVYTHAVPGPTNGIENPSKTCDIITESNNEDEAAALYVYSIWFDFLLALLLL